MKPLFNFKGMIAAMILGVGLVALYTGVDIPSKAQAANGALEVDSFTVTCATTATSIKAPSGQQFAMACQNNGTTAVFFGDSGLTTTTAPSHCADNCASKEFGGNLSEGFCRVAAGTVTIYCVAQVFEAP